MELITASTYARIGKTLGISFSFRCRERFVLDCFVLLPAYMYGIRRVPTLCTSGCLVDCQGREEKSSEVEKIKSLMKREGERDISLL